MKFHIYNHMYYINPKLSLFNLEKINQQIYKVIIIIMKFYLTFLSFYFFNNSYINLHVLPSI